ncbi:nitrogen regulation protein NR(II) [Burkholderia thailandensis]|nr:nitrogen regulation protein NR(II) [Burkholderia thailandensis]AHI65757.1 sensory box protein [Burkholderia thailandensis H0587]AHI73514.1 his Kinase A domain protein [Burkholderia thailandensis 2002721723]AHI77665.1 his Kinase A domain protein [Burkholderia thailandensis E444]AIC88778.1 his Kinase A domain protein [Burkholderia thailandensis USAMRU Malaysia \
MVLKNLIKARAGHPERLSDDDRLVRSGLLTGLEALPTVVLVLDRRTLRIAFANPSAEAMLDISRRQLSQMPWSEIFPNANELATTIAAIGEERFHATHLDTVLDRPGREPLHVHAIVGFLEGAPDFVLVELFENERQSRTDREERIHDLTAVNKQLIRNLAHEIKNPLGGIRGAAQLLEFELGERERDELREYTQVIIKESDRLQTLVDRLLEPHRHPHIVGDVNIHEVCERVRAVMLAEFPRGLTIERDYDVSVPDLRGDKEQLIQALLNIVRNAAQALRERIAQGDAKIELRTRVARKVTIAKRLYRLALDLHVIDNGPGIPDEIRDRIFYPLVSGRDDGSGLGLTLAQTFIQQHDGMIEVDSRPGRTEFQILLPLDH